MIKWCINQIAINRATLRMSRNKLISTILFVFSSFFRGFFCCDRGNVDWWVERQGESRAMLWAIIVVSRVPCRIQHRPFRQQELCDHHRTFAAVQAVKFTQSLWERLHKTPAALLHEEQGCPAAPGVSCRALLLPTLSYCCLQHYLCSCPTS